LGLCGGTTLFTRGGNFGDEIRGANLALGASGALDDFLKEENEGIVCTLEVLGTAGTVGTSLYPKA